MKMQHKKKMKIIQFCSHELREAEIKAEKDSIQKIEAYKKSEKHVFRAIENTVSKNEIYQKDGRTNEIKEPNFDGEEKRLAEMQMTLYGELMDIEINLQEALYSSSKIFMGKIVEILSQQKDLIQNYIATEVMNEIDQFCDKFYEQAIQEFDRLKSLSETVEDEEELTAQLSEYGEEVMTMILVNQHEDVVQTLNNFREGLATRINKQDNIMTTAITKEWQTTETEMKDNIQQRNRAIVEEIVETIDKLGNDVSKKFTDWRQIEFDN